MYILPDVLRKALNVLAVSTGHRAIAFSDTKAWQRYPYHETAVRLERHRRNTAVKNDILLQLEVGFTHRKHVGEGAMPQCHINAVMFGYFVFLAAGNTFCDTVPSIFR